MPPPSPHPPEMGTLLCTSMYGTCPPSPSKDIGICVRCNSKHESGCSLPADESKNACSGAVLQDRIKCVHGYEPIVAMCKDDPSFCYGTCRRKKYIHAVAIVVLAGALLLLILSVRLLARR